MPTGSQHPVNALRVRNGEPQPTLNNTPEPSAKRDLTSWWKSFSKRPAKKDDEKEVVLQGIFGVPLIHSIPYANVAISLFNEDGESYIYGYVPIVVAKCGVYLKEKATDIEGIFRLAGSEKRIKELKSAFDTPPRYGKGLDWTGYTVHDAANILRRYFNHLPEPIIPLQHYDPFRQPLRGHQAEAVGPIEGQAPSIGGFDLDAAVRIYQHNIKGLPSLNRQLLLYILDLLAVFAAKADINKMTTSNLAAIFQPGILSHPQHDMSPVDYRLSQDVLIFLIDNQDHFLIGMEGTAVDEGTVKHVESGPTTPSGRTATTPARVNTGLGRSASASSSAGASMRQASGIRRHLSTSSKRSRQSGAGPSPVTPSFGTPSAAGVHRSNTVPSKRSPAIGGPRFSAEKQSGPTTPATEEAKDPLSSPVVTDATVSDANIKQESAKPLVVADTVQPAQEAKSETTENHVAEGSGQTTKRAQAVSPHLINLPKPAQARDMPQNTRSIVTPATDQSGGNLSLPSPQIVRPSGPVTPTAASNEAARPFSSPKAHTPGPRSPHPHTRSEFIEGPVDSDLPVERRAERSVEQCAEPTPTSRSFTQILAKATIPPPVTEGKDGRKKLQKKRMAGSTNFSAHSSTHSLTGGDVTAGAGQPAGVQSPMQHSQPLFAQGQAPSSSPREIPQSGVALKPTMSPCTSFRSHSTATELSEADVVEEHGKEEKRSFWKGHKRDESKATPTASQTDLHGAVLGGDKSMSSFASSSGWTGRKSLQYDGQALESSMSYGSPAEHEKHEKKGAFEWFHKLRHDHKERSDKRERAKSPPGISHNLRHAHSAERALEKAEERSHSTEISRLGVASQGAGQNATGLTATGPGADSLEVSAACETNGATVAGALDSQASTKPPSAKADLPAALTEVKSVAQLAEGSAPGQSFGLSPPSNVIDEGSLPRPTRSEQDAQAAMAVSGQQSAPAEDASSRFQHAPSDSTATVTAEQGGVIKAALEHTAEQHASAS